VANTLPWKTAWITGGSTGIGRELALQLAAQGVKVAISARSATTLREVEALNPNIKAFTLDVADSSAVDQTVADIIAALGLPDLVVLNAAVWHEMGADDFDLSKALLAMDVNHGGVVRPLAAIMPKMIARKSGQIALVASVAGLRGLPRSAAYAPTKAALINLAECLKNELDDHGVSISIINPGFVDTPMTRVNEFSMPFIITAPDAAGRMISGLKRRKYEIGFPFMTFATLKLFRRMPNWLFFKVTRYFQPLGK
jgi:short-subunit dehydrogenase